MKNVLARVQYLAVALFALVAPHALAFDGTEMDGVQATITALVVAGTAIVIAIGVFGIGAKVFKRITGSV